jgi:hypothetical protein
MEVMARYDMACPFSGQPSADGKSMPGENCPTAPQQDGKSRLVAPMFLYENKPPAIIAIDLDNMSNQASKNPREFDDPFQAGKVICRNAADVLWLAAGRRCKK